VISYIVLEWLLASLFVDSLQPDNGAVARCIVPDRSMQEKNSSKEETHLNHYVKTKRELKSAPC
jgi:hypothetical protein